MMAATSSKKVIITGREEEIRWDPHPSLHLKTHWHTLSEEFQDFLSKHFNPSGLMIGGLIYTLEFLGTSCKSGREVTLNKSVKRVGDRFI